MEFGMFHEFPTLGERSHAEAFNEALEQIDACERFGLDALWLAELHFAPERSVLAAPLSIAAAIAARTRRIKIGIAVQVLPLCHPLRLAEEAATVDQLSRGRLIFGVGRSGVVKTYDAYGIPYNESRDRFVETLDILKRAWTGEVFSYHGTYYKFSDVAVVPRPYQKPYPPLRMAAMTNDTFPLIGELGLPMFASTRHTNWAELLPLIGQYRAAYKAAGHPGRGEVFVSIPTYLAASDAQACAEAEPSIMQFYRMQAALAADSAARSATVTAARAKRIERLQNLSFPQAMREHLLIGSPDTVGKRLGELRAEFGLDGILAEVNCGGLIPHPSVLEAIRLLSVELQPRFRVTPEGER
jgi:alkanesulfonate monooxygenase SsuD/methylene tetrahydromethanopterin reductase-like flavin-dependent oxidoreductase (luciferase family)